MSNDATRILENEKEWVKRAREAWEAFAEEYLGYTSRPEGPPDCFETGDSRSYCIYCPWSAEC